MIKEQKKTYNNEKNGSKKQEQIIEEAQVRTNKIHPNTPFRKQQELKAPPKKTPTSNSEAHLSSPLGKRPLVEERKEKSRISREERKAV